MDSDNIKGYFAQKIALGSLKRGRVLAFGLCVEYLMSSFIQNSVLIKARVKGLF